MRRNKMRLGIRAIVLVIAICLTISLAIIFKTGVVSTSIIGLVVGITTGIVANIVVGKLNEIS